MTRLPTSFHHDGKEWHEGQEVSAMCEFSGEPPRRLAGTLLAIRDKVAFIETQFGTMICYASTLETEE